MLVGFVLIGGVVSTLLLFGIMAVSKGMGLTEAQAYLAKLAGNPSASPDSWYELMVLQAVNHLGTFFLPALAYWYLIERRTWSQFNVQPISAVVGLSLVALIVIAFMPFDGLIIEWNQNLHLPETLAPIEQWVRDKEKGLEGITKYLTTFNSIGQLLMALLVIAVIPAIGEETLFRGVLQRNFIYWTKNHHVGIWLAAALFSAIHVQFLGFFPRMLLGALFGYLYVWSGNLWVSILAHFVNNGFTVLMVYMHQQKMVSVDIESTESVPLAGVLVSGAITLGLLYYFRKNNQEQTTRIAEN
ncbi:CPBP family intramembrane glutamic endopeptidase [Spirosoma pollinicola]|uniref:CPBP family intramembrane metalloprotease domain-containing protein n=1 Tax=Spirosoma pollinicola TaxID=2057025 RepID=A0A2K8ZC05_9BACT|nr:CPBP family intramembrane glutamic endopeptidase [Spirosoma pollinicola]AUD07403.1 CPBP family intramembrane metalloprotease domain-containing protein [Spirosoma pollinicola]